ncbi:GNAT family N-acetyltransferase [Longivirga aurantiaca]|uniref:GNAT family N-acetyltransferase n=1 Tax=Longivirga aurantiaca TaxID=1837743 RepID=A0ABW1SYT8_9ACTN
MLIEIREATAEDLPALARLRWECHTERQPADEHDFDAYRLGFAQWCSARQGRCRAVVAVDGSHVVGMGFLVLVDRVPSPGSLDRHHGDIQSMYVTPAHRNHGVGSKIVRRLLDLARDAGCERIEVYSGSRAVTFYERSGFEHVDRLLNRVLGQ